MINDSNKSLRLSCVRAFLGRIYSNTRLIKCNLSRDRIVITMILDSEPCETQLESISDASAEIIADFPNCSSISESVVVNSDEISKEDIIEQGWIFRRYE